MRQLSFDWLLRIIRSPGFWLLIVLLALITVAHYQEAVKYPSFLSNLLVTTGLNRDAFERILYLVPIIWSGFLFRWKGTVATSLVALACMLPRAIFTTPALKYSLFEIVAVLVVGNAVSFGFEMLRREREHRIQLATLNYIASVVSQSLDLDQILSSSVDSIVGLMDVDAVLIFLLDDKLGELTLSAHTGVSGAFVQSAGKLKLGEGLNGMVAQTGEPALIYDVSKDRRLTKMAVIKEGIRSQAIVPLKSKAKVIGDYMCSHAQAPSI